MADNIAIRTIEYNSIINLDDAPDGKFWSLSSSTNGILTTLSVGIGTVTLNNNTLTIREVNAGEIINLYYYTPPTGGSSSGSNEDAANFIVEAADIIVSVEEYTYGGNPICSATFDGDSVSGTWKASSESTSAIDWTTLSAEEHTAIFIPDSKNYKSTTATFTVRPKTITENDIEYSGGNYPTAISAKFKDEVTGTIEIKAKEGDYATFSNEIRPVGTYTLKFTGDKNYKSYIEKDVTIDYGTITVGFDSQAKCLDVKTFTINLDLQYVNISISPEDIATVSGNTITFGTIEDTALITFSAENYNENVLTIPVSKRSFTTTETSSTADYDYESTQSISLLNKLNATITSSNPVGSVSYSSGIVSAAGWGNVSIIYSKAGYNDKTITIGFKQKELSLSLNQNYFAGETITPVVKYRTHSNSGVLSTDETAASGYSFLESSNFEISESSITFGDINGTINVAVAKDKYITGNSSTTIKKRTMTTSYESGRHVSSSSPISINVFGDDKNPLSINTKTTNCSAEQISTGQIKISTDKSEGTATLELSAIYYNSITLSFGIKSAIVDVDERLDIVEAWKEEIESWKNNMGSGSSVSDERIAKIEAWIENMQKYFIIQGASQYSSIETFLNSCTYESYSSKWPDASYYTWLSTSDNAAFANFRKLPNLNAYRGATPCCNDKGRQQYSSALVESSGIKCILNLEDTVSEFNEITLTPYINNLKTGNKIAVDFMDFSKDYFGTDNKAIVGKLLKKVSTFTEGPLFIHCVEGKSRCGFICFILECLMRVPYDSIVLDFMTSFYNYYGISKESEYYKPGVKKWFNFMPTGLFAGIGKTFDENGIPSADDLEAGAIQYLKDCGLTETEINKIKALIN